MRERATNSERILGPTGGDRLIARRLFGTAATRAHEAVALGSQPPQALMEKAGLAVAQFALAVAPHAQDIWVVCGPGNNGGDGLVAARYLQQWGKRPVISHLARADNCPADAAVALQKAKEAGLRFADVPPDQPDLCIDALLGLGFSQKPSTDTPYATRIAQMNSRGAPIIAVDIPSGLYPETGAISAVAVNADFTR